MDTTKLTHIEDSQSHFHLTKIFFLNYCKTDGNMYKHCILLRPLLLGVHIYSYIYYFF